MEEAVDFEFCDISEIEIDEDDIVCEEKLQTFNDFESMEVVVPDDLTEDDMCTLEDGMDAVPSHPPVSVMPVIKFVDESLLTVTVTSSHMCTNCGRLFIRKGFLERHMSGCGKCSIFILSL